MDIDGDNDRLTAARARVLCFRAFFAPRVGGIGRGPAFEMLSDLPEITKPVSDGTGFSTQTF